MKTPYFFCLILFSIFFAGQTQAQSMDLYAFPETKSNGSMASIDIQVNDFTDIISFQASINWNPTLMTFTNVTNFGISGFDEENFGDVSADQGHLRFVWDPEDASALTVLDSTVLFTANFELNTMDPSPIAVSFMDETSDPPFPIEFTNSNSDNLTVNTFDGSIIFEPKITGLAFEDKKIEISPNPFSETFKISMADKVFESVKIYDISGNLILEKSNVNSLRANIQLNNFPDGVYLLQLHVNGQTLTSKVIKGHEY